MSYLDKITLAPPDAVFGVADAFKRDTNPLKINLSVGAYRDNFGGCLPFTPKRLVCC
jgi:aspartate aminotransferase